MLVVICLSLNFEIMYVKTKIFMGPLLRSLQGGPEKKIVHTIIESHCRTASVCKCSQQPHPECMADVTNAVVPNSTSPMPRTWYTSVTSPLRLSSLLWTQTYSWRRRKASGQSAVPSCPAHLKKTGIRSFATRDLYVHYSGIPLSLIR